MIRIAFVGHFQEWELFIGQAVTEVSESALHTDSSHISELVPSWLEQDRFNDVFQLKV